MRDGRARFNDDGNGGILFVFAGVMSTEKHLQPPLRRRRLNGGFLIASYAV